MTTPIIWINGEFLPADTKAIRPTDRGLLFGDGLYDTMLAKDGVPLHFEMHWARFSHSAEVLRLPIPVTPEEMLTTLLVLLEKNDLIAGRVRLRMTLTRGDGPGLAWDLTCEQPTLLISATPAGEPRTEPQRVCVLPWRRDPAEGVFEHKTTNLLSRGLARADLLAGGDDDGLILNLFGHVCEATTSNIFLYENGTVATPPVEDGLLPGTSRARALQVLGWQKEWKAEERSITLDDLVRAEAVWLSNAVSAVQPIGHLNGAPLTVTDEGQHVMAWLREKLDA